MSNSNASPKKAESSSGDARYRNFATVVYPESAPENWQQIIADSKSPVFISPLHDKDINPNGEPKKPHYHVVWANDGKKSRSQAIEFFSSFGGVGCEVVQSIRGYARYLCHLDNPEKAQYSAADVISYGGLDYSATIGLPTDKYKAIREMMNFCKENQVYSYAFLLEYSAENQYDWFRVLCDSGSVVMKEYLKSRQWEVDRRLANATAIFHASSDHECDVEDEMKTDPVTGEILEVNENEW